MRDERPDEGDASSFHRSDSRKPSSQRTATSKSLTRRGEFDFIERIRRQELRRLAIHKNLSLINSSTHHSSLITHHSSLLFSIGDDAPVIRQRASLDTDATAALLVEGI